MKCIVYVVLEMDKLGMFIPIKVHFYSDVLD